MTYLEELLNGAAVEWKPLGEVCKRAKGTDITAFRMRELHKENAPVRVFAGGKTEAYLSYEDLPVDDIQNIPSVIVKSRGNIEFAYYDGPFSHKKEFWSYHSEDKNINIKFVYYFLKTREPYFRSIASSMGTIPQISLSDTEKFLIPLPPLHVQERIVEILDKFTTLIEALETERVLRTQQYAYYRNRLLRFGKEVEWRPLGEVAELKRGTSITQLTSTEGCYPVISGGRQPAYYVDQFNRTGETITVAGSGAYAGFLQYWNEPIFVGDAFSIKPDPALLLPRFVYFFLLKKQAQLHAMKVGGAVPHVYTKHVAPLLIPLPPLTIQQQIVDILDKFHTLVHSLTEGLPAEIALRRQQYEYYRNQLLRFPR